jgi:hypothetical protein
MRTKDERKFYKAMSVPTIFIDVKCGLRRGKNYKRQKKKKRYDYKEYCLLYCIATFYGNSTFHRNISTPSSG